MTIPFTVCCSTLDLRRETVFRLFVLNILLARSAVSATVGSKQN